MRWVIVVVFLAVAVGTVDARFAQSQGFSGKHGVTCGACHTQVAGDPSPDAHVEVLGLPPTWQVNGNYDLTVRVSGGPPVNPVPGQPQGGFDLETDGGTLAAPTNMSGLLRSLGPLEVTYTGAGTVRREWSVAWASPNLTIPPADVHFWVAGLSANGNHLMDGPDTAGERGDRFATIERVVAPSLASKKAWAEQPLDPPRMDPSPARLDPANQVVLLTGTVPAFADGAQWRIDAGEWAAAVGSPHFSIQLPGLAPGAHELGVRTVWNDRNSAETRVPLTIAGDAASSDTTEASSGPPVWAWILAPILVGLLLSPLLLKLAR